MHRVLMLLVFAANDAVAGAVILRMKIPVTREDATGAVGEDYMRSEVEVIVEKEAADEEETA